MLIVLPPSETKALGGTHPPLTLAHLSFPTLSQQREAILSDLLAVCEGPKQAALEALGIRDRLSEEIEHNLAIPTAATLPALARYTGVLYDAFDAQSLPLEAWQHVAVGSALFGVVSGTDLIPHYRLSAGSRLPIPGSEGKPPTMKRRWGRAITEALAEREDVVVDLRSGAYQALGPLPSAVTMRVEKVQPDGSRSVVSHFNKHYKGIAARSLALAAASGGAPRDAAEVGEVLSAASNGEYSVEHSGERQITVVLPAA